MDEARRHRPLILVLWKLRQETKGLKHRNPDSKMENKACQNRRNCMYLLSREFMNGHSYRKDSLGLGFPIHKVMHACPSAHMKDFPADKCHQDRAPGSPDCLRLEKQTGKILKRLSEPALRFHIVPQLLVSKS